MAYHQITLAERIGIALLRRQGVGVAAIARELGRHRSTIYRELGRNCSHYDGAYRASKADSWTRSRRSHSRPNQRFTPEDWQLVEQWLKQDWSPEQAAGRLRRDGRLRICHETIYRHIWRDKQQGGVLHLHRRSAVKQRRKRYRSYDSRGRLAGKRPIDDRPAAAQQRCRIGDWEADTLQGRGKPCVVTLVDRKTGFLQLGKLAARTAAELTRRTIQLIRRQPRPVRTITADNGTAFHGYAHIEHATQARFYFATPHHAWERGTNENTNGLLRQYLPKRQCLSPLTQYDCNAIARKLNARPRKRLDYRTPQECYYP